jgi:hypothetical protein
MSKTQFESMLASELAALERKETGEEIIELMAFDSYAEQIDEVMKISKVIDQTTVHQMRRWVPGVNGYDISYVGRKFDTWKDVKRAAESLWPEGMEVFERMMDQLRDSHLPKPQNIRRRRTYREDEGDELCLDRLQRGQPYWLTTHRDHRPGPLSVTIVTDVDTPKYEKPENILWRGSAAMCLTELLEAAGYRVELWSVHHTIDAYINGHAKCVAVKLKESHNTLDRSTVINAVSGWSFRTLGFGSAWLGGTPNSWLGWITNPTPCLKYFTQPDEKILLCSGLWNFEDSVEWIKEQLANFDLVKE